MKSDGIERKPFSDENNAHMELHFTRTNGEADEAIDHLITLVGGINYPDIIRETILAALKAGQEKNRKADLKLMNATMKEMRFTAKVFGPYRDIKKVTVFGSARTDSASPMYELARLFGERLAEAGFMVITGGGPGIMQAVHEGAGPDMSFGVNIRLPLEQQANPTCEGNPRSIFYKYFFNRKVAFLKESDAVALFPGGFGTLDEAMETLTLVQTGKRAPLPLLLIDEPGGTYWLRWLKFLQKQLLADGYISRTDFKLFERVDSIDEAVGRITRFYRRYHSLRYAGDRLIIRLTSEMNSRQLEEVKSRFSDLLLSDGDFFLSGPLPVESDEPEIAHLPRLVFSFNRRDFGRLRELIDLVNNE
jgi:uncharacterized protein (TIGR00730 family)